MVFTVPCYDFLKRRRVRCDIQKFYVRQRYLEDCHKEDQKVLEQSHQEIQDGHSNERRKQRIDSILAKVTLAVNVVMVIAKIFAAYISNSLSVLSTVVDSCMDITSGAFIWYALRSIGNVDKEKYPIGKGRLEPLIIVVVAVIMIFANLVVVYLSANKIITSSIGPMVDWKTVTIMLTGTVLKLILFILCKRQGTASSSVLAQDQRNDVLTNLFALVGAYVGHYYWLYADPIGAILLSAYIIANWMITAKEQVPLLIGKAAEGEFTNRIAKISITHDERILALDTIYVYHLGVNYLVELHVLMDAELSLRDAHDVSESLQKKIERLPYVERCFVHCDYELDGDEHLKKYK